MIDANGILLDPHKTEAIQNMKSSTNVTELHRLMGIINQLNKFSPNIRSLSQSTSLRTVEINNNVAVD